MVDGVTGEGVRYFGEAVNGNSSSGLLSDSLSPVAVRGNSDGSWKVDRLFTEILSFVNK